MRSEKSSKPTFDKYGSHYQLRISTIEDLEHLLTVADGRWMATSCPLFGLNVDLAFLKFLDADGSGRIVSDEVREAVRWLSKCLRPSETLLRHQSNLPLDLINTDSPEGKAIEEAACRALGNLNLPDATEISLEQVRNRQKIMAQADYNGDGIIPPEVVKEPDTAQFVKDLIATVGSVDDISGLKGISETLLDQFKKEATAYLQWYDQGAIPEGSNETAIMPFGASTPKVFQAIGAIRDKVDQFFAQCALVRYDPGMADRMAPRDEEMTKLDYRDREAILEHLRVSPLAGPNAEGVLPLDDNVNEVYHSLIAALREQAVVPMFGEQATTLDEAQWRQIMGKIAPHETWLKAKPSVAIEKLGADKLRSYLDSSHDATIRDLIVKDKAVAGEIQQLQSLEKLLLYHQWFFTFVNNYASFPHLFDPDNRALFDMGTLILGGREFVFSIQVDNRAPHSSLAKNSGIYLLYLQITGAKPEDKFEIAVPVTRGSAKSFYVGKRGVFFTANGREFDAQITQIVENPISLWQSIKEPFQRVYALIGGRISQISSSIQKETEKSITTSPSDTQIIQAQMRRAQETTSQPPSQPAAAAGTATQASSQPAATPTARPEAPRASGTARDLMIGTGLLVAGMATALKFLIDAAKQLAQPRTIQILLLMIGIFIAISILIATVSALRKLRQRDLGVLLQASGWAINGRMRLIRSMARLLCRKARIPKGARRYHKELLVSLEKAARKKREEELSV